MMPKDAEEFIYVLFSIKFLYQNKEKEKEIN
jgi:hypothetical protein